MKKIDKYIKDVKEQLDCNTSEEYKNQYIIYTYSNEQIDANIDYFKSCMRNSLSAYKALLFFDDYLNGDIADERLEPDKDKQVCKKCGNDTFRVYITTIIDDARLYCSKCGEPID